MKRSWTRVIGSRIGRRGPEATATLSSARSAGHRWMALALFGIVFSISSAEPLSAACPSAEAILEKLDGLDLESASRSERFGNPVPFELYRSAAEEPGQPFAKRIGLKGFGVVVSDLPIERLWRAINDEDHYNLERHFLPIQSSQVIGGQPRGRERIVFQTFQRWGVGRWWVSRVRMNTELHRLSGGDLWELYWRDEIAGADLESPPLAEAAARMPSIRSSEGGWLMIPITASCTAIEYFTYSEPGGLIRLGQMMLAKRAVRLTLEGLLNLAREHIPEHDARDFFGPDGELLAPPGEGADVEISRSPR